MNGVFKKILALKNMDYLVADRDLVIVEKSEQIRRFADNPDDIVEGKEIGLAFPELIGTEEILNAIIAGEQSNFELKGISRNDADGSIFYFNIYFIGIQEEVKDKNRLFVFLEDVTVSLNLEQELVQAANEKSLLLSALSSSKKSLDKILSSMVDALLVTTESGVIKTVNNAAIDLFGYSEEELIGNSIALIIEDKNFLAQFIEQKFLQEIGLEEGEIFQDLEVVCKKKNQEKIFIEFSCSVINTDLKDVHNFIYIGRDITERIEDAKRLSIQYAAARVLSNSSTTLEAIPKILLAICESLRWTLGELWMPNLAKNDLPSGVSKLPENSERFYPNSNGETPSENCRLRCIQRWCRPSVVMPEFDEITNKISFAPGEGLPGSIWATGSPRWIADIARDPSFVRKAEVKSAGLHAAFGFSIRDGSEILGVMTFYNREVQQPDREMLQMMAAIGSQIGQFIKRKEAEEELAVEREQTELLLLNILPKPIGKRLKKGEHTIAEYFTNVTVLFADIVGFTQLASHLSPIELVDLLNKIFSDFDRLTEKYGLEKIKTIGDAYMVVGGLPVPSSNHAEAIAQMALDMQAALRIFNRENNKTFSIRIGIHSGPVVAGVIGLKKFIYDLWGDTVNIASRMESHGLAGKIHLSDATYQLLKDRFCFEQRDQIQVKGKGEMTTYFLLDRKIPRSKASYIDEGNLHQNIRLATQQMVELINDKLRED
ncbi:MAG: adenylate/guanylate cyclase domain-containing protein [Cyanobacteriota bacterium]|nr:adenylate/guanylate cyclase domain-containing protein [Cyanobacteriota bacterium]